MTSWGARLSDADRENVIDYLFANFGRHPR
jgi:hypothetical protein